MKQKDIKKIHDDAIERFKRATDEERELANLRRERFVKFLALYVYSLTGLLGFSVCALVGVYTIFSMGALSLAFVTEGSSFMVVKTFPIVASGFFSILLGFAVLSEASKQINALKIKEDKIHGSS